MADKYILDGDRNPVPVEDVLAWAEAFENTNRIVAQTDLPDGRKVSTVFLGLDHRFGDPGPPLLFETMVFGSERVEYNELFKRDMPYRPAFFQERYSTWIEAELGHALVVGACNAGMHTE